MRWYSVGSAWRNLAFSLPLIGALLGLTATVQAQGVYRTLSNARIIAGVGVSGQDNSVNAAGRFVMAESGQQGGVLMGIPAGATKPGSYLTVRIDGGPDPNNTDAGGWDLIFGDDANSQGQWLQQPTVQGNRIVARWTTLPGSSTPAVPPIEVGLVLRLVNDVAVYEFTVINRDTQTHRVALRFASDYNVPNSPDGPVVLGGAGQITQERSFASGSIPATWHAFDSTNTKMVGGPLVPVAGSTAPTTPDRVVFARQTAVTVPLFDVVVDPTFDFVNSGTGDGAAAIFFTDRVLPANDLFPPTYTVVIGPAHSTIDFGARLSAGVDGPFSLQFDSTKTNDPNTAADERLSPNPLTITAFLVNHNTINLSNVQALLSLPQGFQLAEGETARKTAPTLAPDAQATFSWSVVATGAASGRLSYAVSFAADPGGQGVSVVRSIDIPSLPSVGLTGGPFEMVSFPFSFDNPTPSTAFGLSPFEFDLLRWNSQSRLYEAVQFLRPGEGYWIATSKTGLNLTGANPVPLSGDFEIPLRNSWNQIGNPFGLRVRWGDIMVINTDVTDPDYLKPLPVEVASDAQHQWILPTIYRYDTAARRYEWDQDFSTELVPFTGYWVRALKPTISLLIPAPANRSARITTRSSRPSPLWRVQVVATAEGKQVARSHIGVGQTAADGFDLLDVEQPPAMLAGYGLAIERSSWGGRAGLYMQDIQAATPTQKQWTFVVSSPGPDAEVTLSWPDLRNLPRGYELYITDPATGQRRAMRQLSSLRVNTGQTGTRQVVVTAVPRSGGAFRIVNAAVRTRQAGQSATVQFTATQDASVQVQVLSADGRTLRTLSSRDAAAGGTVQMTWDYRDSRGAAVPAGLYTILITGRTADGQSASVPVAHVVTR
jgi:hypothetical protein